MLAVGIDGHVNTCTLSVICHVYTYSAKMRVNAHKDCSILLSTLTKLKVLFYSAPSVRGNQ